jgi:hypothetical protein
MDRRKAIQSTAITVIGLISLPEWMVSCGMSDTATHQSSFTSKEQNLLASIADTIIPAGNAIGALAVGVDKYLQKLIDDCCEKTVQENIKKQLSALNNSSDKEFGKSFSKCTQADREKLLLKFSASPVKEEKEFFDYMKSETIRGFTTSQKVMQDYLGYKVAPGHYYGCVTINT